MASFFAVLAIAAGTFWLEAPGLIRRKHKRELGVFMILLLMATALYGALVLKVQLPNPFYILKFLFHWLE